MYSSDKLFQYSQEGYFGVYFPSCEATAEINTKVTPNHKHMWIFVLKVDEKQKWLNVKL